MLRGKLVVLRPVQRSDITYFLKWFNDPEVIQYLGLYLPMTEMAEEKYIENIAGQSGTNVIFVIEAIEKEKLTPIGTVGLHQIHVKDHRGTFGISIGEKDYWSKGYGTETARLVIRYGFEELNLHRISSGAISFNERSIALHLKVGFKEEGRQREAMYRKGRYYDQVKFGILREDWDKSQEI